MIVIKEGEVSCKGKGNELLAELYTGIFSIVGELELTPMDIITGLIECCNAMGYSLYEVPPCEDEEDEEDEDEMLTEKEVIDFLRFLAENYKGAEDDVEDERSTKKVQSIRKKGHEELDHRKAYRRRSRE